MTRKLSARITSWQLVLAFVCVCPDGAFGQDVQLVSQSPSVVVAGMAGDSVLFGTAIAATRLSDGTIVVADPLTPGIVFFDRRGRATLKIGRKGTGPGEFTRLRWLGQCARDTLFAFEQARIQVLSSNGRLLPTIDAGGRLPGQLFCNRSGIIAAVAAGDWGTPGEAGTRRITGPAWTLDATGKLKSELGTLPVTDAAWNGAVWQPVPLGRQMFLAVDGTDVILGTGESQELATFSKGKWEKGPSLGSIVPKAPTPSEIEAGVSVLLALAPNRNARGLRDQFVSLPRPDSPPFYHRLSADGHGRIWAQLSVAGTSPTRLRWVDRSTGRTGDVTINAALVLQEAGRDYLLAIEEMDSGEQRVVEYGLRSR